MSNHRRIVSERIISDPTRAALQEDRELLARAVASVVLQRDVSLSRRVYTWLLSGDENKEKQVAYFKAHGLNLLSRTLKVGASIDVS